MKIAGNPGGLAKALSHIDWQQVILNGGPPCFFVENGKFCLRAERWVGHPTHHGYVSLKDLVNRLKSHAAH
jgi:hypothetical protein